MTSQGVHLPSVTRAASIEVGRTYRLQNQPDTFTVLAISIKYERTSVSAYRTAWVRDAQGFHYSRWIHAGSGYIEMKG